MAHSIVIKLNIHSLAEAAVNEIHKWGEANKEDANIERIFHLQADMDNNHDYNLLLQYAEQRAKRICDFVSEYLTDLSLDAKETEYTYSLTLPEGWNDAMTYTPTGQSYLTDNVLTRHFCDYVINGTVADWFSFVGSDQGGVSERKAIADSTDIIRNIYRKHSTITALS